jgi:allantoinase
MPLNAHPPTVNAAAFQQKLAVAQAESLVDFALWGGIVPGNRDELDELAALGVIGFKAFMSRSGTADFPAADDLTLFEAMQRAARLDLPVAVHAESDVITAGLAERAQAAGRGAARDYLDSRPIIAELEAIQRAITLAEEAGCKLHIVHVSSGRGIALITAARARGVDVSAETCPHYLVLSEEDVEQIGAAAKCAPPLRDQATQADLWAQLLAGAVDMVASDHSPAPPEMKTSTDFFQIWGGIAGIQSTLALLLDAGYHQRGLALAQIAALTAHNPATRLGLAAQKGALMVGNDADLVLVELETARILQRSDLHDRHRLSPYVGRRMRGMVKRTIRRGTTIFRDGVPVGGAGGHLVRATHPMP